MRKFLAAGLAGFMVVLLLASSVAAAGERASGNLVDKDGKSLGRVTMTQDAAGKVAMSVTYSGIPAGQHGIHVHAVGKCDGPDFMSAGGHFNPESKQHGHQNAAGPHAGDIANNLTASAGGSGTFNYTSDLITLAAGPKSVFDADGAALVIHANADDFKTDATGNSGGRIACAVLQLDAPGIPAAGVGGEASAGVGSSGWLWLVLAGLVGASSVVALVRIRRKAAR